MPGTAASRSGQLPAKVRLKEWPLGTREALRSEGKKDAKRAATELTWNGGFRTSLAPLPG